MKVTIFFNKMRAYIWKSINAFTVFAVVLLLVILPLYNKKGFINHTITSKFVLFLYVSLGLIVLYVLKIIFIKQYKLKFSRLDIFLFLFVTYISINRYVIQVDYGFSIRYMELLGLGFIYILLRGIHLKNQYWFLLAIVTSGIMQAIYGNLQLLGYLPSNHSGFNITGSFFNPGPYAGFLVPVWTIALGMYLFKTPLISQIQSGFTKSSKLKMSLVSYSFEYIPLVCLATILLVIPATRSRASWLAMLISGVVLLSIRYKIFTKVFQNISKAKKVSSAILLLVVLMTGLYGGYHFKKDSADGRLLIWKVSKDMIKDHLIVGVGFDQFQAHYMDYQADYFSGKDETSETILAAYSKYAFNEYIQLTVENGIIGLVILGGIIYLVFIIRVRHEYEELGYIIKGGFIAAGVFAFFSYPMQILPVKLILVVLLALLAHLDTSQKSFDRFQGRKNLMTFCKGMVLVAGLGIIFSGIYITNQLSGGFLIWKEASYTYSNTLYKESIKEYESTLEVFDNNGDFLVQYGQALFLDKQYDKALQILTKAEKYTNNTTLQTTLGDCYKNIGQHIKAETAYQKAANMVPTLFYPNYLLAKLYDETGQHKKALRKARELVNKKIKIESNAIQEIKEAMREIIRKNENSYNNR